jgi:O-antigen ligase
MNLSSDAVLVDPQRLTQRYLSWAGWLAVCLPFGLLIGNAGAEFFAGLLVIAFTVSHVRARDFGWLRQDWVRILLLLWVYTVVRAGFSLYPRHSLTEAVGWLRFILLAVALQYWVLPHKVWQQRLVNMGLLCMAWLGLDSIIQFVHGKDLFGHVKQVNYFHGRQFVRLTASYNKAYVGIMMAWQFLPYVMADAQRKHIWRALVLGTVTLLAIFLSGERLALLFTLLSMAIVLAVVPSLRRVGMVIALVLALGFGGIMVVKPSIYQRQVASTWSVVRDIPHSTYGVIWTSALKIIHDYPVFGVGMNNFEAVCRETRYGPDDPLHLGESRCPPHPHNLYLEWLVEGGAIAVAGFTFAMLVILRRSWQTWLQHKDSLLLASLVAYFTIRIWPIASQTSFFHGWAAIPFWMGVGWMLSEVDRLKGVYAQNPDNLELILNQRVT